MQRRLTFWRVPLVWWAARVAWLAEWSQRRAIVPYVRGPDHVQ